MCQEGSLTSTTVHTLATHRPKRSPVNTTDISQARLLSGEEGDGGGDTCSCYFAFLLGGHLNTDFELPFPRGREGSRASYLLCSLASKSLRGSDRLCRSYLLKFMDVLYGRSISSVHPSRDPCGQAST